MISADLFSRLCRSRQCLRLELEAPVPVRELARTAGLSTPHFIAQFAALFGETPLQCRSRARLERARDLLSSSGEPMSQIALALGFENQGSFSRWFSRQLGQPPRVYRRHAPPAGAPAGCVALMNLAQRRI